MTDCLSCQKEIDTGPVRRTHDPVEFEELNQRLKDFFSGQDIVPTEGIEC